MTLQMKETPDAVWSTLIAMDRWDPPTAPLAMPKQILTPPPGQLRRALGQVLLLLTLGRKSLRRAD